MNIVYFYCEGTDVKYKEAWDRIDELNAQGAGIIKELTAKADDYSYGKALAKYWGKDDLILIEQDNVVSMEQLNSLISCAEAACAYWFVNSAKWHAGTLSIGCRLGDPTFNYMFNLDTIPMLEDGTIKYATFSGTGLTKISKRLQKKEMVPFCQQTIGNGFSGLNCDNAIVENINSWLDGWVRFHLHGEVKHSSRRI